MRDEPLERSAKPLPPPAPPVTVWKEGTHSAITYRVVKFLLGWFVRLIFLVHREGHKTVPRKGPVILVSNHVSNLDPVLVVCSMRRPVFHLGKHTLFTKPFWRMFFMTLGGQIPVDRSRGGNEDALSAAIKVVEGGNAFGIYPEGSRSPDGRLHRGRTGVARIALTTGAPVFPVAIMGTSRVWPKGKKLPRLFRRTRVVVGKPRSYPRNPDAANHPQELRRVTDEIMSDLARLLGEDYDPAKATLLRNAED